MHNIKPNPVLEQYYEQNKHKILDEGFEALCEVMYLRDSSDDLYAKSEDFDLTCTNLNIQKVVDIGEGYGSRIVPLQVESPEAKWQIEVQLSANETYSIAIKEFEPTVLAFSKAPINERYPANVESFELTIQMTEDGLPALTVQSETNDIFYYDHVQTNTCVNLTLSHFANGVYQRLATLKSHAPLNPVAVSLTQLGNKQQLTLVERQSAAGVNLEVEWLVQRVANNQGIDVLPVEMTFDKSAGEILIGVFNERYLPLAQTSSKLNNFKRLEHYNLLSKQIFDDIDHRLDEYQVISQACHTEGKLIKLEGLALGLVQDSIATDMPATLHRLSDGYHQSNKQSPILLGNLLLLPKSSKGHLNV